MVLVFTHKPSMPKLIILIQLFLTAIISNAQIGSRLILPIGHRNQITAYSSTPDKKFLITGCETESRIIIWELETGRQLSWIDDLGKGVNKILMSPDGTYFIVSFLEGPVVALGFPSLETKWKIQTKNFKTDIELLSKGKFVVVDGNIVSAETGIAINGLDRISYVVDDSTYVIAGKKEQTVYDINILQKIKTIHFFPFEENKKSVYNQILQFNRNDQSSLFVVSGHVVCYNNLDSVKYEIVINDFNEHLIKIPGSDQMLVYSSFKKEFVCFNVNTGAVVTRKNLNAFLGNDEIMSEEIGCSPDNNFLLIKNQLFHIPSLSHVQYLDASDSQYAPGFFSSPVDIIKLNTYPLNYQFQKIYIEDLGENHLDSSYGFRLNDFYKSLPDINFSLAKWDNNSFIFGDESSTLIRSVSLVDNKSDLLLDVPFVSEEDWMAKKIVDSTIQRYFPRLPQGILEKSDTAIIFLDENSSIVRYDVETGYRIDQVIYLGDNDRYLISLYPKQLDIRKTSAMKDKVECFSIHAKKSLFKPLLYDNLMDFLYDPNRDIIVLNEFNRHLHILDAKKFTVKREIRIDRVIKEVGWFNKIQLLDSTAKLIFYTSVDGVLVFNTKVLIFDWETQKIDLELIVPFRVTALHFSSDLKICYLFTGKELITWDVIRAKALFHYLPVGQEDWLVYDDDYHYDGTAGARDLLYFGCGTEIVELNQMKDALYVPGLAGLIQHQSPINYKKLSELEICGTLPLVEKLEHPDQDYHFKLTERKFLLDRVILKINDKPVITRNADQLKKTGSFYMIEFSKTEVERFFVPGQSNSVKLEGTVRNGSTEILTRGVILTATADANKKPDPNFYAVMVGINDYKDGSLHLNFPSKDAIALGKSVQQSAKNLLGNDHVFLYNINTDYSNSSVKVSSTPEKEGIRKVLQEIGKRSKPEDILFIFFAGHGVMQGATDKKFTFLTAEASSENLVGVSTDDLKNWLSPEGPNKMLANKCILIFDACNSGQATKEIGTLLRNVDIDETNRIRQVEDLKDKSGMFILAASAPNQNAYELPQYQQGLLTYCLLSTLKNQPGILDDNQFLNVQKWFLYTEELLRKTIENLGLKQNAQPYGTANIPIGVVDEVVKSSIQLATEKPAVFCLNAENISTEEDGLRLRARLNSKLREVTSRGIGAPLVYVERESSTTTLVKLKYEIRAGIIQCSVSLFKDEKRYYQQTLQGSEKDVEALINSIISLVQMNARL